MTKLVSDPTMPIELMTDLQVAAWLNVTQRWLVLARLKGDGPPFIKLGRLVRYRRHDVEGWLEQQSRSSTSATGPASSARVSTR